MKPTLTPLDAAWTPILLEAEAILFAFRACEAIDALVRAVLAVGSPLVRPGQEQFRRAAASGMAELGLDRFGRDGVRLSLVPARTVAAGGEHVVVASSYVRVSLDPRVARALRIEAANAAPGVAKVVDLETRRAAQERVA